MACISYLNVIWELIAQLAGTVLVFTAAHLTDKHLWSCLGLRKISIVTFDMEYQLSLWIAGDIRHVNLTLYFSSNDLSSLIKHIICYSLNFT